MLSAEWTKSSWSGQGGDCVEVRHVDGVVELRESEEPEVVVRVTSARWLKFLSGAKAGEFDLPR